MSYLSDRTGNIVFRSKAECDRYLILHDMEIDGEIIGLKVHPKFELLPKQFTTDENGKEKVLFRATYYIASFMYIDPDNGEVIVEDLKHSHDSRNRLYELKRKMMWVIHRVYVREIEDEEK